MGLSEGAARQSTLARLHPQGFRTLQELYPVWLDDSRLARLDEIYASTEIDWHRNLVRLRGFPIRYLMLAEAAPWSESGPIAYFYGSGGQGLPDTVAKAARLDRAAWPNWSDVLVELARKGFLLIDSLPFAVNYSEPKHLRDRKGYETLVEHCANSFVRQWLGCVKTWAPTVRVALAYKVNGKTIIAAHDGRLILSPGVTKPLDAGMAVANGAGHPDVKLIRKVFGWP